LGSSKTGEAVKEWSWPPGPLADLVVSGPYARFEYFQFPERLVQASRLPSSLSTPTVAELQYGAAVTRALGPVTFLRSPFPTRRSSRRVPVSELSLPTPLGLKILPKFGSIQNLALLTAAERRCNAALPCAVAARPGACSPMPDASRAHPIACPLCALALGVSAARARARIKDPCDCL